MYSKRVQEVTGNLVKFQTKDSRTVFKKTKTFSFLTVVPRTENSISESGIEGARRRCCWDRPAWSPAAWRHGGAAQGGRPVASVLHATAPVRGNEHRYEWSASPRCGPGAPGAFSLTRTPTSQMTSFLFCREGHEALRAHVPLHSHLRTQNTAL